MSPRIHAAAGGLAFLCILCFWTTTALAELFGGPEAIRAVKTGILWGMALLVPAMAVAGASGMALGRRRRDARAAAKRRRMPLIAANGLLVLIPSAVFLQARAAAGAFDGAFLAVQALELAAGALNIALLARNIRDGRTMARGRARGAGTA